MTMNAFKIRLDAEVCIRGDGVASVFGVFMII
jgi:hypothetical protein